MGFNRVYRSCKVYRVYRLYRDARLSCVSSSWSLQTLMNVQGVSILQVSTPASAWGLAWTLAGPPFPKSSCSFIVYTSILRVYSISHIIATMGPSIYHIELHGLL